MKELQMGGISIPQHPYNKALRAIPISYPGIAMLNADADVRFRTHELRRRSGV
jgi:hypothetical protein